MGEELAGDPESKRLSKWKDGISSEEERDLRRNLKGTALSG